MFQKKVTHKGKDFEVIKHGKSGKIYMDFASVTNAMGFSIHQKRHYREKLHDVGLLIEKSTIVGAKKVYIFELDDIIRVLNSFNPKDDEQFETIKSLKKTIRGAIRRSMKNYRPEDIQNMIDTSKIKDHFNKVKNEYFEKEYNRVDYNLYGMKMTEKLNIKKNISTVWNYKKRKSYENFDSIKYRIATDIGKIEKSELKKALNKRVKLSAKLDAELQERRPEYHFTIIPPKINNKTYLLSYNHALEAIINKNGKAQIVTRKFFKSWKEELKKELKRMKVVHKYNIDTPVIPYVKARNKKIKLDLIVYIHMNTSFKKPDHDNYVKAFQDAICELFGINDTDVIINNLRLEKVKSYDDQKYEFGLRLEK